MTGQRHAYRVTLTWIGNLGRGTEDYKAYSRDHTIGAAGRPDIAGSADPAFRGDPARWNPEELLLASVSACHQLWYLHLCAAAGIGVISYRDDPEGVMQEDADGGGRFVEIVLRPQIGIAAGSDAGMAERLHHDAHAKCFIANSVGFPIAVEPVIVLP